MTTNAQKFTKKPITITASQWFKNGDHPLDYAEDKEGIEGGEPRTFNGAERKANDWEGGIVRRYRHPDIDGQTPCKHCGVRMHDHGWIDTKEGGHIVCPSDWIITGIQGEYYPCKADIFAASYSPESVGPAGTAKEAFDKWATSENFEGLGAMEIASLGFDAGHSFWHAEHMPRKRLSDDDHVAVPRSLLGALAYAVANGRESPRVLAKLRRYTTGDLSMAVLDPIQAIEEAKASGLWPWLALVEVLKEAKAGLEFASDYVPKQTGEFIPTPLLALKKVNDSLASIERREQHAAVERLDHECIGVPTDQADQIPRIIESDYRIRTGQCPNGCGLMSQDEHGQDCLKCKFQCNMLSELPKQ